MKITEYSFATELDDSSVLLTDGDNGTKQILTSDAIASMLDQHGNDILSLNGSIHAAIPRGKYLGDSLTTEQIAHIQDGTFEDLWVGDYWTIDGVNYRIADINYWIGTGDTEFTSPHLVIVPDTHLYTAQMNSSNTTSGGYVGSEMYTTNLATALSTINSAFGDNLLTYRDMLTTAVTSGYPSSGSWYDCTVELMTEPMVYGSFIFAPGSTGSVTPRRHTVSKTQLALFRLCPQFIATRTSWWLRDVVSSTIFAHVSNYGTSGGGNASNSVGVRPAFAIG